MTEEDLLKHAISDKTVRNLILRVPKHMRKEALHHLIDKDWDILGCFDKRDQHLDVTVIRARQVSVRVEEWEQEEER